MKIDNSTEKRIQDIKRLADNLWNKHIDIQYDRTDVNNLIAEIWKLYGSYEHDKNHQ